MKVQLPFHNHAAGRSGGSIFQTYWGRTFARSMPVLFHYPDTPSQHDTQMKYYNIVRQLKTAYPTISLNVPKSQRYNTNVYNIYSQAVFQILNPYAKPQFSKPPRFFGLDKLNRVILPAVVDGFSIEGKWFYFRFHFLTPVVGISDVFNWFIVFCFNRSRHQIYCSRFWYTPTITQFSAAFGSSWAVNDDILMYFCLSGQNWLGNFNLAK